MGFVIYRRSQRSDACENTNTPLEGVLHIIIAVQSSPCVTGTSSRTPSLLAPVARGKTPLAQHPYTHTSHLPKILSRNLGVDRELGASLAAPWQQHAVPLFRRELLLYLVLEAKAALLFYRRALPAADIRFLWGRHLRRRTSRRRRQCGRGS